MRRKVIQHFANMLPQRFLDLPEGFDLAILAKEKRGTAVFDFLQASASIDGVYQPEMRTSASYSAWLLVEAERHGIPVSALLHASMNVTFEVTGIEVKESYGHIFHSAIFNFECASEFRTAARSYVCQSSRSKAWSYGYYWEQLFGSGRGA